MDIQAENCDDAQKWMPNTVYKEGAHVIHDEICYKARANSQNGEEPGSSDRIWIQLQINPCFVISRECLPWNSRETYKKCARVCWQGTCYRALTDVPAGVRPGDPAISTYWVASGECKNPKDDCFSEDIKEWQPGVIALIFLGHSNN